MFGKEIVLYRISYVQGVSRKSGNLNISSLFLAQLELIRRGESDGRTNFLYFFQGHWHFLSVPSRVDVRNFFNQRETSAYTIF